MRPRTSTDMDYDFELLQYGYTVCPPDWGIENANAIFYRMYYIQGGEGYYMSMGETVWLRPGYFYILPLMRKTTSDERG